MENTAVYSPVNCAISIVVPMYNVEKYIGECLESILAQTFQDFEVIVVDDCSTDKSVEIAESYTKKFGDRLKIYINEQNSGASATRNKGLWLSRGEYVFFMDSDDLILPDGLEKTYKIAKYFDVDVVNITKSYKVDEEGKDPDLLTLKMARMNDSSLLENNLEWRVQGLITDRFAWAPWRRLSRRDFLIKNRIFFPEKIRRNVDEIWTFGLFLCAKKVIHVPIAFYLYRRSENSISRISRTPAQKINSRVNNIINNLKWVDGIMKRLPFFETRPDYYYAILEHATQRLFKRLYKDTQKVSPVDMFLAIKEEFGNDFGENELVVPMLCTIINGYKKVVEDNQLLIAELENKLRARGKS